MARDELRQPLRKRSLKERLWAKRPSALAAASVLSFTILVAGSVWLSRIPYPFAGEPVVVAVIPPPEALNTASTTPSETETGTAAEAIADEPVSDDAIADAPVEAAADPLPERDYSQEASIIMATHRPLKVAPIAAVTEEGPTGPLPRISSKGKKPSDVYAQVTPSAIITSERPKIAIVLGGMGINARLTQKAIKELPGDISFGFAPYGENLQEQVNKARAKGHEILLQLPLEPVGYPGNNPGPQTLLADVEPDENLKSLYWHMGRFTGFSGVTNYMGSRFLAAPEGLSPILAELKKRGLVYLEDATVSVSVSPAVARQAGLPMRRASTVIDVNGDAASIADALAELEKEATANGFAIGTGSGLEVTIDTVAEWAKDAQERGILLIPVSAAYRGQAG